MNDAEKKEETDPRVALPEAFSDDRGVIQPLVDEPMKSALLITGRKGSVRGNHSHRTDWHYCYVVEGLMEYHWRPSGSEAEPQKVLVRKGQLVFTPPMTDHAFVFIEDTMFIALARNSRDQTTYESDTVRVEFVG